MKYIIRSDPLSINPSYNCLSISTNSEDILLEDNIKKIINVQLHNSFKYNHKKADINISLYLCML